jgi:hypothetical protein
MTMPGNPNKRILGIDPFSRGVGYALLERQELIDWGLKSSGKADNRKSMRLIEDLLERYQPDILALEDWNASGARRCARVETLLSRIAHQDRSRLSVRLVSHRQLLTLGPLLQVNTKFGRASFLAGRFPELLPFLPPFRMAIFDAVAFAVACLPIPAPLPDPSGAKPDDTPLLLGGE